MARLFVTGINLNKNELQNARIQNLSSNPSSPVAGQIYFNTTDNEIRYYDGTQWISGSSVEFGNTAARPAASKAGQLYVDTEANVIYVDNGTTWNQGTVSPDDVDGWIQDHSNLTTGVHGVSGNVVGTSDTQTLSNKTISDNLHFNNGDNAGYIAAGMGELLIDGTNTVHINADEDVQITTTNGDIVLNADGSSYIGSVDPDNRIVTVGELNSSDVVQSVSGTTGEVAVSTDVNGDVTVSLPDAVHIHNQLYVGSDAENETSQNGTFYVKKADGSNSFLADSEGAIINGDVEIQDGNGNAKLNITYSGTGATRLTSSDDIAIRSTGGDIILYPGSDTSWGGSGNQGKAYVGWGNDATDAAPENEITTAGNTQSITNKTVNDELYFTNPSTQPNDGGIKVNDTNENLEIRAYTADLNLYSNNGDINLDADGDVNITAPLFVYGNLHASNIYGENTNGDGSLTLLDGSFDSQIHISGTTKNIELLPHAGSKAFYGSSATAGNEIAKISDLQALSSGLDWKAAVNVHIDSAAATAMGLSLSESDVLNSDIIDGNLVIDGHTINNSDAGYRILVTGNGNAKDGIWVLQSVAQTNWTATRAEDSNTFEELIGAAVFVMEGDQYAATSWVQNSHYITNFTEQYWIQFSGQGTYIGSDSIQVDGNQINVLVDNTRGMYIDGDGIYLSTGLGTQFGIGGAIEINAGTGFDVSNGVLEFATSYGVRKYAMLVGDGTATSYYVEHGFGTRDVTVQIFQAGTPYAQVEADIEHTDTDSVTVKFATAPVQSEYRVVVVG